MIMQLYQTISEVNVTGLDGILIYVTNTVPSFIYFLLIAIFLIITMGIYLGTKKFGSADFFAAATVGGFITTLVGIIMTIPFGMINLVVLIPVILLTIIFFIVFMIRRNRD